MQYRGKCTTTVLWLALVAAHGAQAEDEASLGTMVVTATGEQEQKLEIPVAVDALDEHEISENLPAHPSEIMDRIPGVLVTVTGGEGHMTAIRQPITTKPMYLYLEDGVPTRSTGFFNHNALYEINLPQSAGVEVLRGPGTALYGSDAIGAVVNVLTREPPEEAEGELSLEASNRGWRRLLADAGNSWGKDGLRADLNLTHDDGWRDATGYDRQSATLRWDRALGYDARLKTVLSGSRIRQQTAGSSRLLEEDYLKNPTLNYTPISYRDVDALRLSTEWAGKGAGGSLQLTGYLRDNRMDMLPNWSLSYDPVKYVTRHRSVGALLRWVGQGSGLLDRVVAGADLDYSPGSRHEQSIVPVKDGKVYVDYSVDETIYDYDVTFMGASPYVQVELLPLKDLRLDLGLRYDHLAYDYENHLGILQTGSHRRPASTTVSFSRFTPKLGLNWKFRKGHSLFASWRQAFRAPSEGQLFRQGRAENSVGLRPVLADSWDGGVRGRFGRVEYELVAYLMYLHDDIVSYTHADGTREVMNAGETEHRGIEAGMHWPFARRWSLDASWSWTRHLYRDWSPKAGVDYSGNEMERAPRHVGSTRLSWRPDSFNGGRIELEWVALGRYWMDQANTEQYPGHDLFNLRGNLPIGQRLELMARVINLTDERYATIASYYPAAWSRPERREYAPGMPRTVYGGIRLWF